MNKTTAISAPFQSRTEQVERFGDGYVATQKRGDMKYIFYGDTAEEAVRLLRAHLMKISKE